MAIGKSARSTDEIKRDWDFNGWCWSLGETPVGKLIEHAATIVVQEIQSNHIIWLTGDGIKITATEQECFLGIVPWRDLGFYPTEPGPERDALVKALEELLDDVRNGRER
jgi:hypothetical protein